MPTTNTSALPVNSGQRRSVISSRLRENRPQTPQGAAGANRRRRSRSPDARIVDESTTRIESSSLRKKRKSTAALGATQASASSRLSRDSAGPEDHTAEHGVVRRPRSKHIHRPQSQLSEEVEMMVISEGQPRQGGRTSRKDRSRSRDTSQRKTLATDAEISDDEQEDLKRYTGPLAAADMIRMRKELETSRKQLHISEKKIIKQNKEIEKLKRELATAQQSNTQHCQTIEKYKTQTKKSDEIINAIEGHINCSVCMDLMHKPHGLSPCGHVLCQECLQSWFRAAVPDEDEMYDDEAGDFLLYKKKTCPVCRSTVRSRPIQLFVIKSIASTLRKVKTVPGSPQRASPVPDEEDPWKGIFFEEHGEGSHLEDDDEDDDDDEGEYEDGWSSEEGYGTPTDEEPYDGVYIIPRWSPPTVNITPFEFPFLDHISDEDLSMLRRGVTLQMIDIFNMRYNHDTGLQATIDGVNTVFLGFNIHLLEGDESGEEYMDWVLNDIHERPDRWEKVDSINGSWRAWMLVPEIEEDDYSTTDSEVWAANIAAEAEDDDELDFL